MNRRINRIESGLLQDLLALYTEDLVEERHAPGHSGCSACAKLAIVCAIANYFELDELRDSAVNAATMICRFDTGLSSARLDAGSQGAPP
jgi:hypothetical protein